MKIENRWFRPFLLLAMLAAIGACDDATSAPSLPPSLAAMSIVSGDGQSAAPGTELPDPLIVRVVDEKGKPVPRQIVNFQVTRGSGEVFAGVTLTDDQGRAQEHWTLGQTPGVQEVEARAVDAASGDKQVFARFSATAIDEGAVADLAVSPTSTSLVIGDTRQFSATATNADGEPLEGTTFTWKTSDSEVATVSSSGLVTARAEGSATITATAQGESGTASVSVTASSRNSLVNECASPADEWVWCDDFERDRLGSYFEYDGQNGAFARASGTGAENSVGMRARFGQGQTNAGSLKLAFGQTPSSYMRPVDGGTEKYREIYFRFYVRNASNWTGGGGDKMARATVFAREDWSQAMVAHLWSGYSGDSRNFLFIEAVSGTDAQGNLQTSGYNDFDDFRWIGSRASSTPIFDSAHVGQWYCVESRVRLNAAGQSNGAFTLWVDDQVEASSTGLNWVGSYDSYGINSFLLENYWNDGSPQAQERFFDNLVVSTARIGCGG